MLTIHTKTEGVNEYTTLFYIPKTAPMINNTYAVLIIDWFLFNNPAISIPIAKQAKNTCFGLFCIDFSFRNFRSCQ